MSVGETPAHGPLEVGFGEVDLTPSPPADVPDAFRVLDRLAFRAVALRSGTEHAVLLTGDFFSFEEDLRDLAAARLRDIPWLDARSILPCVSHCGGAPILKPSYVTQPCAHLRVFGQEERYASLAADAIRAAVADLKPARIGLGTAPAPGFSYNRRSFDADGRLVMSNFKFPFPRPELTYQDVDENVYVIRVDDAPPEGELSRPRGAAIVFGCHALSRRDCYGHVWADYPATAREIVGRAWGGVPVAFMQGALGDVVPVERGGRAHRKIGHGVGGAALMALERVAAEDAALRVRRATVRVPVFGDGHIEEKLRHTETGVATDGDVRFWEYTRERVRAGETELDYTITVLELGSAAIVHLPGEAFVQTARAIREASPFEQTVVVSGPTADVGYLCPAEAHAQGGMEPQYAALAASAEETIRGAAIELLRGAAVRA